MLQITLDKTDGAYRPGDEITGTVQWDCTEPPAKAEIHLGWATRGKGSEDADAAESVVFDHPQARDQRSFRLRAPVEPCSFSGKLISVVWTIELFVEPGVDSARKSIVIAPDAREIVLPSLPEAATVQ